MTITNFFEQAQISGRTSLTESEGKTFLRQVGFPVPKSILVHEPTNLETQLESLNPPLVLKVVSKDILHKSDVGGVRLGLSSSSEVHSAILEMQAHPEIAASEVTGWLVEEMIDPGHEIVIGAVNDPNFGMMLMLGMGGIYVEVLQDVSFRLCPILRSDAEQMIDELKCAPLLKGVRGQTPADIEALIETLLRLGGEDGVLLQYEHAIAEMDLNPVILNDHGLSIADARFMVREAESGSGNLSENPNSDSEIALLNHLFKPRTVAVVGASSKKIVIANTFIKRMQEFGYEGEIYPIHPNAPLIEGLKTYPDLSSTPKPVDYAYVAIGAAQIPGILRNANGNCKVAQVISSGFGEVAESKSLETELVKSARIGKVRILGPNCLGTYSPRGGLTFPKDAPRELGSIGVVSQSGGLSTDIVKRGQWKGLRFSGLVTIGNSADLKPADIIRFYLEDEFTNAIGIYVEDAKDGREIFNLMRSSKTIKPLVILKGGLSDAGAVAAASHTGALAENSQSWFALSQQCCAALVSTVDEFIDTLLALQFLDLRKGLPVRNVTLFGNGGGASVLGVDAFAENDLSVLPFDESAVKQLQALNLPAGTSVLNPIDTPVGTLLEKEGWIAAEILDIVYRDTNTDVVVMHLNLAAFVGRGSVDPIDNLFAVMRKAKSEWSKPIHFVLVLRSDGSEAIDNRKRELREIAQGYRIPVFDEIAPVARVLANISHFEKQLSK